MSPDSGAPSSSTKLVHQARPPSSPTDLISLSTHDSMTQSPIHPDPSRSVPILGPTICSCGLHDTTRHAQYNRIMLIHKMGLGHCVPNGTVKLSSLEKIIPPRRRFRPVVVRAASTSQSQIIDVKRLKGIRMRPRTPEDDEKKVRHSLVRQLVIASLFRSSRQPCFRQALMFDLSLIRSSLALAGPSIGRVLGRVCVEEAAPRCFAHTTARLHRCPPLCSHYRWTDQSPNTWESVRDVADNLLRDFEAKWWTAVKKCDEATINEMMDGGAEVLSRTLNPDRRSALHFAAALGKVDLVRRLIKSGAEVDLGDKEGCVVRNEGCPGKGIFPVSSQHCSPRCRCLHSSRSFIYRYTPLHMASGYLHTSTIQVLIENNADPEQVDLQGRSPLALVESLRAALPPGNPATAGRRLALEEVLKCLTDNVRFECAKRPPSTGKTTTTRSPVDPIVCHCSCSRTCYPKQC